MENGTQPHLPPLDEESMEQILDGNDPGTPEYKAAMYEKARRLPTSDNGASRGQAPSGSKGQDIGEPFDDSNGLTWNLPIPLHSAERPLPLPLHVFPSWLEAYIRSVASFLQVPTDLAAVLALSVLAGALQKKVELQVRRGWTEPLILWTAAILGSGERKSPAFKLMTGPIKKYEKILRAQVEEKRLHAQDHRDVLQKRLEKAKKHAKNASVEELDEAEAEVQRAREKLQNHEVPTVPQLWVDDTTSESLLQVMSQNDGRILAMSPEGDFFKFVAGRYNSSGTVLNTYKKSWTGRESIRDNRITRDGFDVNNPALSAGICVQPSVLENLAHKRQFQGEGLLARFLYVVPESKMGRRKTGRHVPPLDAAAKARYEKHITELLELRPKAITNGEWVPYTLRLSENARPVLWDFQEDVESMLGPSGRLDGLQDWGGKLVGQALRISGLLHVADASAITTGDRISAETLDSAFHLARGFIPHAKTTYGWLC